MSPDITGLRTTVPLIVYDGVPLSGTGSIDSVSPNDPPVSVILNLKLVTPPRALAAPLRVEPVGTAC